MQTWVTRISRALMMGLAWAVVWVLAGVVGGRLIVGEVEPEHIGGPLYAGVLCGAVFSTVAGIAAGRRRVDELSFSRAAAWGAVSGLLVALLPFVLGDQHGSDIPRWVVPVIVIGSLTVMSAVSAVASMWLARMAKMGKGLDAGADEN